MVDRRGAGQVLTIGTLMIGVSMIALSMTTSLIWFYIAYCLGRMTFAGPFEIANTSAVANWFIHLRARAMSFTALAHSIGLAVFPIVAFAVIYAWDWRAGWLAIAGLVVVFGVVVVWLRACVLSSARARFSAPRFPLLVRLSVLFVGSEVEETIARAGFSLF